MRDIFVEEARDSPTWFSPPVKSQTWKSDPAPVDLAQSPEYWQHYRSLAGSPFDSSDSDSSSDCDDDVMSLGSSDLSSSICEAPFSGDGSLVSDGLKTLDMESNALGLVFFSEEGVFATEAVATLALQAEGLQAPRYHQDDRSCGRPNQKYHAQQEHVVSQSDGPADDTLVRRFPQDIGLWADVSDASGPKLFQGVYGSSFEKADSFGDGRDQQDAYDLILRAPKTKSVSLPEEQEYDEDLLYSGTDLGGWVTGTLDAVPRSTMPELGCLDIGLSIPFAMD